MASGKAIGEFSLKIVTTTLETGPAGSVLLKANLEGTATGFGSVFQTATFIGGNKDGTCSIVAIAYLDNGDVMSGLGQGSYENKGKHRWATTGTMELSDGRRIAATGEIDLVARSWKGTISE